MFTFLKLLTILIVTGGSSYGYFSSHRDNMVENSEDQEIQQETTSENVETAPIEPSDENTSPSVQEAEKKKVDATVASETIPSKGDDDNKKEKKKEEKKKKDKSSDNANSIASLSQEAGVQEKETSKKEPKPCFTIDNLVKYAEGIYYRKSFVLNGTCSKDADTFEWYFDNIKIGTKERLTIPLSSHFKGFSGFREGIAVEIKLVAISADGISKSESKKITLRKIPEIDPCITPKMSDTKELELGKEIEFDASCTKYEDENPVVKYSWIFRDGKEGESESGKKVSHTFTKGATTITSSECGGEGQTLGVELQLETKLGNNNNAIYHYCIKK